MRLERNLGNYVLVVYCHDSLADAGRWLLDTLEQIDRKDCRLSDGTVIQLGWTKLSMVQRAGNELTVSEPDFNRSPMQHTRPDVSVSLAVLIQQKDVLERLNIGGAAALFSDKVVYERGVLGQEDFYLERIQASKGNSGWFIGMMRTDGPPGLDKLAACYVYNLIDLKPEVMPIMALPVGYLVVFANGKVKRISPPDGDTSDDVLP